MEQTRVIVSPSPHIHSGDSISRNMYNVLIALIPAFAFSIYQFGWQSLLVTAISVGMCCLTEWFITTVMLHRKCYLMDGSAILTGVLLAFNLPSNLSWWIILIGAFVAMGIGKMAFGGLGNNIFNPALVTRIPSNIFSCPDDYLAGSEPPYECGCYYGCHNDGNASLPNEERD